ncbi:hypothetical protein BDF14DRAFT_1879870 [Spinellus fusiger]|nr:hypothetical protein BDF14DRAFT_1879870 [Spinellus fusiger]
MDTARGDNERTLSTEDGNSVDRMVIDEPFDSSDTHSASFSQVMEAAPKPFLPSITNIHPFPPHSSHTPPYLISTLGSHTSDEFLRHRMSDMSVSAAPSHVHHHRTVGLGIPRGVSPAHEAATVRGLSPLEPTSQYDAYTQRSSVLDTTVPSMDYRMPFFSENNSRPHVNPASMSRRASTATVLTDYDGPSRSPSPSPSLFGKRFAQESESSLYGNRRDSLPLTAHPAVTQAQAYDPFQRRHSIATAEPAYSNSTANARPAMNPKYRAGLRFPATIQESPHGTYSAPSSPPPPHLSSSSSVSCFSDLHHTSPLLPTQIRDSHSNTTRYPRHGARHVSISGSDFPYQQHYSPYHQHQHQHQQQQQQQQQRHHAHPYAVNGNTLIHHRRKSIMTDEAGLESSPSLSRRASMPVVTMRRHLSTHDLPYPYPPVSVPSSVPLPNPMLVPAPSSVAPLLPPPPPSSSTSSSAILPPPSPPLQHTPHPTAPIPPSSSSTSSASSIIPSHLQHKRMKNEPLESSEPSPMRGYHPENSNGYLHHEEMNNETGEDDKGNNRSSETPYSRSPELRVSHKLAERKRRKEMKELFDELRDSLPVEKNLKTSKWEILSKAVEYIDQLKRHDCNMENELAGLRREVASIKRDQSANSHFGPSF